jgi:GNAT superfamily N-acetyltransferase
MNAASSNGDLNLRTAPEPERDGIRETQFRILTDLNAPEVPTPLAPAVAVRAPIAVDIPALAALFAEMQRHYKRPVTDRLALEAATLACQPVRAMFDPRVLIAEMDGVIVGSIVLNVTFPAFELSRSLYIRDLYVSGSARRHGIGRALVNSAAELTYAQGFSALDWTTETLNAAARKMYEGCGARVLPRTYYRLAREDMVADERCPGPATSTGEPVMRNEFIVAA